MSANDAVEKPSPPKVHFTGRVLLCNQTLTPEAIDWLAHASGPLGFDCEWAPDRTKKDNNPIALIQLADHDTVLLLRTCGGTNGLAYPLPNHVRDILQDENVVKVCSGFDSCDAKKFRVSFPGLQISNVLEITRIATKKGLRRTGLRGIAAAIGTPMAKKKEIACSDWGAPELSAEQIQYAADDADLRTDATFIAHFEQCHIHAPDEFNSAVAFERHLAMTAQKGKVCIHCAANGIYMWSHTSENCENKTRRACAWCLKAQYVCVHDEDECPWKQQAHERRALKELQRAKRIAAKKVASPEN